MAVKISGPGGTLVKVDGTGSLYVNLPATGSGAGYVRIAGGNAGHEAHVTDSHRLIVATDRVVMYDPIEGAVINPLLWNTSATTFTIAQTNDAIALNSANGVTAVSTASIGSVIRPVFGGRIPTVLSMRAKLTNLPQANALAEFGICTTGSNSPPGSAVTDGAFFRCTVGNVLQGVVSFAGSETAATLTAPAAGSYAIWEIKMFHDSVHFIINDQEVGTISAAGGNPMAVSSIRNPIVVQVKTPATAPALAPRIDVSQVFVTHPGQNNHPMPFQLIESQPTRMPMNNPSTFAQATQWANSAEPANAALSNTAASYTTLGGIFRFLSVSGSHTDNILFGFNVPENRRLVVVGMRVDSYIAGLGAGATPTALVWAVAPNATTVNLSTADSFPNTFGAHKLPLGIQSWAASAAVGVAANPPIVADFTAAPLVTDGGRFFDIVMRTAVGAATAGSAVEGIVAVYGYFE